MGMSDHVFSELFFLLSHISRMPTEYFILCMYSHLLNYIFVGYLCCFQMTASIFVHKALFSRLLLSFFL